MATENLFTLNSILWYVDDGNNLLWAVLWTYEWEPIVHSGQTKQKKVPANCKYACVATHSMEEMCNKWQEINSLKATWPVNHRLPCLLMFLWGEWRFTQCSLLVVVRMERNTFYIVLGLKHRQTKTSCNKCLARNLTSLQCFYSAMLPCVWEHV